MAPDPPPPRAPDHPGSLLLRRFALDSRLRFSSSAFLSLRPSHFHAALHRHRQHAHPLRRCCQRRGPFSAGTAHARDRSSVRWLRPDPGTPAHPIPLAGRRGLLLRCSSGGETPGPGVRPPEIPATGLSAYRRQTAWRAAELPQPVGNRPGPPRQRRRRPGVLRHAGHRHRHGHRHHVRHCHAFPGLRRRHHRARAGGDAALSPRTDGAAAVARRFARCVPPHRPVHRRGDAHRNRHRNGRHDPGPARRRPCRTGRRGEPAPRLLATGGAAALMERTLQPPVTVVPDLTLRGLAAAWRLNAPVQP